MDRSAVEKALGKYVTIQVEGRTLVGKAEEISGENLRFVDVTDFSIVEIPIAKIDSLREQ